MEKAVFALGCFWKPQFLFSQVPGVVNTKVGYIGGNVDHPHYRQVCTDTTGHAEGVLVEFDPQVVSYKDLVTKFFAWHDATTLNYQGPDHGTQYRSAVFYYGDEQKKAAEEALAEALAGAYKGRKIVTEIVAAPEWWEAEEYHQDYYKKHGAVCS